MGKVLSLAEIRQRYDREWVLIVEPKVDENLELLGGEVLAHSPNVEVIYRSLDKVKGRTVSIDYIGQFPEDFAAIL